MRDPRQEARRIPHAFSDTADGGRVVTLFHETDGQVPCPPGKDYADATSKAMEYIAEHYPDRTI